MYGDWDSQSRSAPLLWCDRVAQARFEELLNPGDIWRAHGKGIWLDELMPPAEDTDADRA